MRSELAGWAGYGSQLALVPGIEAVPDHHPGGDASLRGPACTWSAPTAVARHPGHGSMGWIRQWIESVNDTLKGQLDLERHGARTTAGVYARIAQRLLAMAATIWHNWATADPSNDR